MCKIALAQEFKLLNLLRLQNVFRRQLGFVLGSEGGQNNSEENSAQGYFEDALTMWNIYIAIAFKYVEIDTDKEISKYISSIWVYFVVKLGYFVARLANKVINKHKHKVEDILRQNWKGNKHKHRVEDILWQNWRRVLRNNWNIAKILTAAPLSPDMIHFNL